MQRLHWPRHIPRVLIAGTLLSAVATCLMFAAAHFPDSDGPRLDWLQHTPLSPRVVAAPAPVVSGVTAARASNQRGEMFDLVNEVRHTHGLPALRWNDSLADSAQSYALYLGRAAFFAHVGPDGSTLVTRNEASGYLGWTWVGENLAGGQISARQAVNDWLASETHRAVLLAKQPRDTGVGFARIEGSPFGYYWVQEFGAN